VGLLGPKQPSSLVALLAGRPSTHPVPLSAKCFVPLFVSCRPSSWAPSWSRVPPPIIPMIPWMGAGPGTSSETKGESLPSALGPCYLQGTSFPSVVLSRLVQPLAGNLALVARRTP
jgi:hypothetical protein